MNTGQARLSVSWNIKHNEIAIIATLLVAFLANIQILVLGAFGIACLLILFSSNEESIDYLAFFTSFAGILVYQGKHMYFVMVALFILRFLFLKKVPQKTYVLYALIVMYCYLFCDINSRISFANLIGLILLLAIPIIATMSSEIDCRKMIQHYIFGFVISTIIGFFAENIPAMKVLFEYDPIWTKDHVELTRFCGLAFDSNFYALSNYIIVAYLLLAFRKLDSFRAVLVVFLVIAGLQTVSKSYILVLAGIGVFYLLKVIPNIKQFVLSIIGLMLGIVVFSYISNVMGYSVIEMVTERFAEGAAVSDNTNGRMDIWMIYFDMFAQASPKELVFGHGFNAVVTRAAHNTFIEFMFHYGVVGCIMWAIYFFYCGRLFHYNGVDVQQKSSIVAVCLLLGIFFLSAYTYESFWFALVISLMTLGGRANERIKVQYV